MGGEGGEDESQPPSHCSRASQGGGRAASCVCVDARCLAGEAAPLAVQPREEARPRPPPSSPLPWKRSPEPGPSQRGSAGARGTRKAPAGRRGAGLAAGIEHGIVQEN
ncbi:unnamed protein product [Caretta caretta]